MGQHHPTIVTHRFVAVVHCACGWDARVRGDGSLAWAEHVAAEAKRRRQRKRRREGKD